MEQQKDTTIQPVPMEAAPPAKTNWRLIVALQFCVLLFSVSSVLMKLAAMHPRLSLPWLGLYFGAICIIGLYALAWQQFLKRIPLTTAYANRAMTMLWSMMFGVLVFHEKITWNMLVGVAVIGFGVYLVVTGDTQDG